MGWTYPGRVLAFMLAAGCGLPGAEHVADAMGRAVRAWLPWRLSSSCARCLAKKSTLEGHDVILAVLLWMCIGLLLGALDMPWAWAGAVAVLSITLQVAMVWAGSVPWGAVARGRLWLAMASSSELAGSMGEKPGGPLRLEQGDMPSARQRRMLSHVGFLELARRLRFPIEESWALEPEVRRTARIRLRGMMLACAGSEPAARWLWRRRRSQWSMDLWALAYAEGAPMGGERWEIGHAIASMEAWVMPRGNGRAMEMTAKEASESSVGMLWATPQHPESWREGDHFERETREECLRVMAGIRGSSASWGWREPSDKIRQFKSKVAATMRFYNTPWKLLADCASELLERDVLDKEVSTNASRSVPSKKQQTRI